MIRRYPYRSCIGATKYRFKSMRIGLNQWPVNQSRGMALMSHVITKSNQIHHICNHKYIESDKLSQNSFVRGIITNHSQINRRWGSTLKPIPEELKTVSFQTTNEILAYSVKYFSQNNALGTFRSNGKEKYYEWMTYKELGEAVRLFRRVLNSYHIEKGHKIAIICNNRVEWVVALYAANSIGAQLVPMYEAQLAKDWQYIIEDSGARLVLVGPESIYEKVKGFVGTVGNVQAVLSFDASEDYLYSYKRSMKLAEKDPDPQPIEITADDHSVLIYTSGTTGKPKGVVLSHRNIVQNIQGIRDVWVDNLFQHTALAFLPWAHVFGQVAELQSMIAMGGSIAIVSNRELILECLPLVKPSIISSVPMLFNKVYDGVQKKMSTASPVVQKLFRWAMSVSRKRNKLLEFNKQVPLTLSLQHTIADRLVFKGIREKLGGNLVIMASGGAGVSIRVLEFFEDIGIPISEGYGLTETSPVISTGSLGWKYRRLGCVGVPLRNLDVRIVDPSTFESRPHDTEGEIIVAGPSVMVGYHNNQKANDEVFINLDGKKFFKTGDLGMLVEGKFLKITGRLKEQFKLENGKYVVPAPLEDDICRSLFISQAFIYGDNKPFNCTIIVPDFHEVKAWMTKHNIAIPETNTQMAANEKVIQMLAQEVNQVCGLMKSYERPARFAIIDEPFTQENQMLTPKLSLRRANVMAKYGGVIAGIYSMTHGHAVPRKDHGSDGTPQTMTP